MPPQRERYDFEKSWPAHVWCIGLDNLDRLGIDDADNLYWDGKPIEIKRPLSLSTWQRTGAVIVTVSAAIGAIAAAVSAYADLTHH